MHATATLYRYSDGKIKKNYKLVNIIKHKFLLIVFYSHMQMQSGYIQVHPLKIGYVFNY